MSRSESKWRLGSLRELISKSGVWSERWKDHEADSEGHFDGSMSSRLLADCGLDDDTPMNMLETQKSKASSMVVETQMKWEDYFDDSSKRLGLPDDGQSESREMSKEFPPE